MNPEKKILIVDDEPSLGELIGEFCRQAGFEVRVETDPIKVLEAARVWKPDLITLDIEMPGVDGIEVLRRLHSQADTCRIPVVIISVVGKGALDEGLLKGARMVFEKPLRFTRLVERLKELAAAPALTIE